MLTSSSLGDGFVEAPRRRLFERLQLKEDGAFAPAQARIDEHQWRTRPDVSVRMERSHSRTVSRTCITVTSHTTELRYHPLVSAELVTVRCRPLSKLRLQCTSCT